MLPPTLAYLAAPQDMEASVLPVPTGMTYHHTVAVTARHPAYLPLQLLASGQMPFPPGGVQLPSSQREHPDGAALRRQQPAIRRLLPSPQVVGAGPPAVVHCAAFRGLTPPARARLLQRSLLVGMITILHSPSHTLTLRTATHPHDLPHPAQSILDFAAALEYVPDTWDSP